MVAAIGCGMNVPRAPHRWRVSPREAVRIQDTLAARVSLSPAPRVRRILGLDCAFAGDRALAVGVVWDLETRQVLEVRGATARLTFPYVPGLLSFRETPVLLRVLRKVRHDVDALMCDGQGVAHPRRFGLASHLGVIADMPCLGAAKSLLVGEHAALPSHRGATVPLIHRGERVGTVVRTRGNVKPVYASPGHRVDYCQAAHLTMDSATAYRIPEPTRLADRWVGMLKKGEVTLRGLDTLGRHRGSARVRP
ncbi:MAG: endonuclease V [Gammaproteobacteria bacterium]|nr:endonuclease V [Gammaproteobacteria bacterium]